MMLRLALDAAAGRRLRVLCIGAHSDDIEIGCGGTLLHLQGRRGGLLVDWVVLSGDATRQREAAAAMRRFLRPANRGSLTCRDFPDGRFPAAYDAIKDFVESLKARHAPDLIFCHERDDRHQDHRLVNEVVWSTFRDHLVLEYEIPKWDGGLGQPNLFVPLTRPQVRRKVESILSSHHSQSGRDWFDAEVFRGLLRLRGVECRAPSGYAEAFHARKIRFA
jgi:LmbE family N-acetylglucosaminyl deacetylase